MRPTHDDTAFRGDAAEFGYRAKNRDASTIMKGHVVCFWATASETLHFTQRAFGTAAGQGANAYGQQWANKVIGVLNESIAGGAEGLVNAAGLLEVSVTGTVNAGDHLMLSGSAGLAEATSAGWIWGQVFGRAQRDAVGKTVLALVYPWRI